MKNKVKYGGFVDFGGIVNPEDMKLCEETFRGKIIDELVDALDDDMRRRVTAAIEKEIRQETRVELRKARRAAVRAEISWHLWLFRQRFTKRR